jgi:calcium/calmodulin-dependent protein kinase I
VKLYEYFEDKERINIVMEYCAGGTLHDKIILHKANEFPEGFAASIIQQILSAVNYLHKNNIVHRDINPSNIFFVDNLETKIKIGDFGVA